MSCCNKRGKRGVKAVVVDKAPIIRSGSGGAGVDHWHEALTNPCAKGSPEDMEGRPALPYTTGHLLYIAQEESWDALLDVEKMGVRIRDEDDEFAGAPFRDDETKLLFAYEQENGDVINGERPLERRPLTMEQKSYLVPNPMTPCQNLIIDPELCTACLMCVNVCRTDVLVPNPEKNRPPVILYPDECWFCGNCVAHCPVPGAIRMQHPLNQRIRWKRKEIGEYFRVGMKNPPPPIARPPVGMKRIMK